jgi:hypothetical protein
VALFCYIVELVPLIYAFTPVFNPRLYSLVVVVYTIEGAGSKIVAEGQNLTSRLWGLHVQVNDAQNPNNQEIHVINMHLFPGVRPTHMLNV